MRCGDPNHWHLDCPLPWKEVLGPKITGKGKGQPEGKEGPKAFLTNDFPLIIVPEDGTVGNPQLESPNPCPATRITPPETGDEETGDSEDSDDLRPQYYVAPTQTTYVCTTVDTYKSTGSKLNGHGLNDQSPLMLLDSGASITVAGQGCLKWRNPSPTILSSGESINFRFGGGPARPSQGSCVLQITLPPKVANNSQNQVLKLKAHIVKEDAQLLISRESLSRLGATLDFKDSSLRIHNQLRIQLAKTPSGHLMLPGSRFGNHQSDSNKIFRNRAYAASLDITATELNKEELRKIHLHLGHCSASTLITMIRAAHMVVPTQLVKELYEECQCPVGIHRATPPNVS